MGKKFLSAGWLMFLCFQVVPCVAQDDSDSLASLLESRHRLDFSLVYLDSTLDDSLNASLAYAYNFTEKTNFSVAVSYLDSRLDLAGGSGIGDTSLTFSWAPFTPISVGPWVPRRIGTGVGVILPTGDAGDGRSLDSVVVTPFLGLVIPVTESFYIYPMLMFMGSVDETIIDEDLRLGVIEIGAGWVSARGVFLNGYISWIKDYEIEETYLNTSLSLGMNFSAKWSASLDWDDTDFFVPGTIVGVKGKIEKQFAINLHYNF